MLQILDVEPGIAIAYVVDELTELWCEPETVVLVHGLAESSEAWRPWVAHLARHYRVVRIDQRGFGRSTPMPENFPWSLDVLAGDLEKLVNATGGGPVHVIGAKIGATVSTHFTAKCPALVKTLTVIGLPVQGPKGREDQIEYARQNGVRAWARSTMKDRLGSEATEEMLESWSDLMGRTAPSTLTGFVRAVGGFDVAADLPRITCPLLAISSDSKRHPVAEVEAWRPKVKHSEMVVIPGDGFHASAVNPDICARAALEFIGRHPIQ